MKPRSPGGNTMFKTSSRRMMSGCVCGCEPTMTASGPGLDRRNFLAGGVAALGLGAAAAGGVATPAVAQAPAKTRIDVHHHFIPKFHVDYMNAPGRRVGGNPPP